METVSALISSLMSYISAPGLALVVMFVGAGVVLFEAQQRSDFDIGNFLKNDAGKESMAALGGLAAIVLSGWVVVYSATKVKDFDVDTFLWIYAVHLAVWSGTKVAEKLVDAFSARWSGKTAQPEQPKE